MWPRSNTPDSVCLSMTEDRGQERHFAEALVGSTPPQLPFEPTRQPSSYLFFTSSHLPSDEQSGRHGDRCPVSKTGIMFLEDILVAIKLGLTITQAGACLSSRPTLFTGFDGIKLHKQQHLALDFIAWNHQEFKTRAAGHQLQSGNVSIMEIQ